MMRPFNTVLCVVEAPILKLFSLLLPNCNVVTLMNHNVNFCFLIVLGDHYERL